MATTRKAMLHRDVTDHPASVELGRPRAAGTSPAIAPAGDEGPLVDRLAAALASRLASGRGGTITWLNHYTALVAMRAGVPLRRFSYLGVDGTLLCRLLRMKTSACRTSADLVLPRVLEQSSGLRVALVGSTPETLQLVADKIATRYGHDVVLTRDGYAGLPEVPVLRAQLAAARAQLVIVGLGTPLQDNYALGLGRTGVLVATCGGWLDQFSRESSYYPAWAYPLRLNWLVRLVKEPRRLWQRYTVDAVRAVRARALLAEYVSGQGGRPLSTAAEARVHEHASAA